MTSSKATLPVAIGLDCGLPTADLFERFLDLPYPVLLDAARPDPSGRRFSYIAADPFTVVRSKGGRIRIESAGKGRNVSGNPFDVLAGLVDKYRLPTLPDLPPFQGGAAGYFAYELGRHLERLPCQTRDDLDLPEMCVGLYSWVIARNELDGQTWIISTGLPSSDRRSAEAKATWVRERALGPPAHEPAKGDPRASTVTSNMTKQEYLEALSTIKRYIVAGDIYQVNFSQRFEAELDGEAWHLYRRLRSINPAPFGSFLGHPDVTVLSASPELFLESTGDSVSSRPMKGTRPRSSDTAEDRRLAAELSASVKDRAENVMIVDLVRNDLGRVSVPGSVLTTQLFGIEQYETVHQMVSVVNGRLRPGVGPLELLRACFPGGSVTGAPKIRSMEIIDSLEPTQRSVYCGAIGYIGFNGAMSMSMPIRILLVKEGRVYFQVGGGIVYDSDPEAEYQETLDKARGSLLALGLA